MTFTRKNPTGSGLGLATLVLCLAAGAARAQEGETRGELWPEVDAYLRLGSSMKLFGLAAFSTTKEQAYSDGQYGLHWDVSWKRRQQRFFNKLTDRANDEKLRPLMFRVGYRYSGTIEADGEPFQEHRGILEAHVRWSFKGGVLVSDRNRVDLRWVDGVYSWRYRNRVTIERETGIGDHYRLTPYVSGEIYYDSRHDAWTRNRFGVGVQTPLHSRLMLDTYYMRQNDSQSEIARIDALGLALNVYF